ncbi:MAG TPA: undecaprenyl-diphosphate phosphatase, partial [Actinomycetota bacterium]|nr:undecaprenyl-diphosphate phosphatase [Actinomycetota bacterium]
MSILQAIVLGLVQGATEFAPVSSSGHLILVPWIFGWMLIGDADVKKSFDVALHMGTLLGALIYFRHDVIRYARAWF